MTASGASSARTEGKATGSGLDGAVSSTAADVAVSLPEMCFESTATAAGGVTVSFSGRGAAAGGNTGRNDDENLSGRTPLWPPATAIGSAGPVASLFPAGCAPFFSTPLAGVLAGAGEYCSAISPECERSSISECKSRNVGSSGCTDDPDAVDDGVEFDFRDAEDRSGAGEVCISDEAPDKGVAREDLIRLALMVEAEWPGPEGRLTSAKAGMCRVEQCTSFAIQMVLGLRDLCAAETSGL